MDNNTNNTSIFLNNPEENLSISQCKLITHTNNNELQLSLLSVFGPKLSLLNRSSIDHNYKPNRCDSIDTQKGDGKNSRNSYDMNMALDMPKENKRSSNSNSLNATKNNLHIETSDNNNSFDESFRNFAKTENEKKVKSKENSFKKYERHLDNLYLNIGITLITLYALFASDIQAAAFNLNSDLYFDILTLISLGIFSLEMIASFILKKEYRFSFFFWLDFISTFSLLLDVTWIQEALFLE